MSVNGIGIGYPAWREVGKVRKNGSGTDFAGRMTGADMAGSIPPQRTGVRTAGQDYAMEAYRASTALAVRNVKPAYETYESENYRIVPDNEAGCFDIYNKQGERLGAFSYSDIKARQDSATGKQFLISEHGTMSYDAVVLDGELKAALQHVMGVETLETEELSGFTLKTHSGTGIQYLVRDGEEGRGGKVLLQSEADIEKYEALAETYFNKYPNLIHDKNAAYIWADLEIKGLAGYTVAGYETSRTGRNAAGGNFGEQAAEAAQTTAILHGAEEGSGDTVISSWADVVSGLSISIYKTQDFDAANPVYKVKTWDKSGNVTEQMVDVSKVDPENCDTAEMYAYTAHLKESGKGSFEDTVLKAAVAKAVKNAQQRSAGSWSFSEKTNWVKIVNDIMQSKYRYGDLEGYMEWKKFMGLLPE